MFAEMMVIISVISTLVVALIIVILKATYERALAELHADSSSYSLSAEGDISHLEDCLRSLPWVVDLQTELGPDDSSGNMATTILITVADTLEAERELPKLALEDATALVTAFSRGRYERGVTFAPLDVIIPSQADAGIGAGSGLCVERVVETELFAETAVQVEKPGGLSSRGPARIVAVE